MSSVQEAMFAEWQNVRDEHSELPNIHGRMTSEHKLASWDWEDEVGVRERDRVFAVKIMEMFYSVFSRIGIQ